MTKKCIIKDLDSKSTGEEVSALIKRAGGTRGRSSSFKNKLANRRRHLKDNYNYMKPEQRQMFEKYNNKRSKHMMKMLNEKKINKKKQMKMKMLKKKKKRPVPSMIHPANRNTIYVEKRECK